MDLQHCKGFGAQCALHTCLTEMAANSIPRQVMTVVKTLTKTGITICATIHNPTPYCFNLFDRLMILLHGRVVYNGENGVCFCMRMCLLAKSQTGPDAGQVQGINIPAKHGVFTEDVCASQALAQSATSNSSLTSSPLALATASTTRCALIFQL